ncbi:MAG: putative rane protein [Rhodospirillales bacterium]|nr:putative rane protein [Rhodospirillales bacterium]
MVRATLAAKDLREKMPDPHALSFLYIPSDVLIALDNRSYRFALQPFHHLVRMAHILSISAFFGAIVLLDLRLTGLRPAVQLKALSELAMPVIYWMFGIGVVSGLMLFFYDPVHVASHAYFSLKIILIVLGMFNAALFNRRGFVSALNAPDAMPRHARIIGAVSLMLWIGVMICATLNVEAAPKVLLR